MRMAYVLALGALCGACASLLNLDQYSNSDDDTAASAGGSVQAAEASTSAATGQSGAGGSCDVYQPTSDAYQERCVDACADAAAYMMEAAVPCDAWPEPCVDVCRALGDAAGWCTDEYDALITCLDAYGKAAYECAPNGGAKPNAFACPDEQQNFWTCIDEGPTEQDCPEAKCADYCAERASCRPPPPPDCEAECLLRLADPTACNGAWAILLECGYSEAWACSGYPVSGCERQVSFWNTCMASDT